MKTTTWLIILVIVAALAFALGKYWSQIKTVYTNKDKIQGAADVIAGLEKIFSSG